MHSRQRYNHIHFRFPRSLIGSPATRWLHPRRWLISGCRLKPYHSPRWASLASPMSENVRSCLAFPANGRSRLRKVTAVATRMRVVRSQNSREVRLVERTLCKYQPFVANTCVDLNKSGRYNRHQWRETAKTRNSGSLGIIPDEPIVDDCISR